MHLGACPDEHGLQAPRFRYRTDEERAARPPATPAAELARQRSAAMHEAHEIVAILIERIPASDLDGRSDDPAERAMIGDALATLAQRHRRAADR